jgi:hypothetical protein
MYLNPVVKIKWEHLNNISIFFFIKNAYLLFPWSKLSGTKPDKSVKTKFRDLIDFLHQTMIKILRIYIFFASAIP